MAHGQNAPSIDFCKETNAVASLPSMWTEVDDEGDRFSLKMYEIAGPDGVFPFLIMDDGEEFSKIQRSIRTNKDIPMGWYKSLNIPILKKADRSSCAIGTGINLMSIEYKMLMCIVVHLLFSTHGECMHEDQVSFDPVWGCIDRTLTLWQILQKYVHVPQTQDFYFSWFQIGLQLTRSCSSLTMPLMLGCTSELHFTHPTSVC